MEVTAGLRAGFVVEAAVGLKIQPDARQKFKLLICRDSFLYGNEPFRRNIPGGFLTCLERRNRSPSATR